MYTDSIISLFVHTYDAHVHTYMYIAGDPLPCGKISSAAFNTGMSLQKHAAKFQGQRDFE